MSLPATNSAHSANPELREFLVALRRALLIIVRYIEKRYDLPPSE